MVPVRGVHVSVVLVPEHSTIASLSLGRNHDSCAHRIVARGNGDAAAIRTRGVCRIDLGSKVAARLTSRVYVSTERHNARICSRVISSSGISATSRSWPVNLSRIYLRLAKACRGRQAEKAKCCNERWNHLFSPLRIIRLSLSQILVLCVNRVHGAWQKGHGHRFRAISEPLSKAPGRRLSWLAQE